MKWIREWYRRKRLQRYLDKYGATLIEPGSPEFLNILKTRGLR